MFHHSACDISQTCFNRGVESVVVPKTSATAESGWIGLAKYAWSGYVRSYLHCIHCTAKLCHLISIMQSTTSETVCTCTCDNLLTCHGSEAFPEWENEPVFFFFFFFYWSFGILYYCLFLTGHTDMWLSASTVVSSSAAGSTGMEIRSQNRRPLRQRISMCGLRWGWYTVWVEECVGLCWSVVSFICSVLLHP